MNFSVSKSDFIRTPQDTKLFLVTWKTLKGYNTPTLELQHCIELLRALTANKELYEGNIKDSVIELDSFLFAHDGEEPIDVIFPETVLAIKRKLYLKRLELTTLAK